MRTVTLAIADRASVNQRFINAMDGTPQGAFISFASPDLIFKILTAKRWELLQAMTGAGALSIREAARRLQRDVKAVHGDVQTLLNAGLLEKDATGKIIFPYDAVHVDFMLKEAA